MFKLAIVCGGVSNERGISINSARSVYDHLSVSDDIDISIIYVDRTRNHYAIDDKFLYSNTPDDFDFKLDSDEVKTTARRLSDEGLIDMLSGQDMVFPIIHGAYGEDGEIQHLLEENNIPFVGPTSAVCEAIYDKFEAGTTFLKENGFKTMAKTLVSKEESEEAISQKIQGFIQEEGTDIVVKPAKGGSSLGITILDNATEAMTLSTIRDTFSQGYDTIILEPKYIGKEFTIIIIQNDAGEPVALIPTEIDYPKGHFDYRKKYMASNDVSYHCPPVSPEFSEAVIDHIRKEAARAFKIVGDRDFLRIDGWLMSDGHIYFSDFNPISGMEQNSFMFEQSALAGFTHQTLLFHILENACKRYNKPFTMPNLNRETEKQVHVIFGGTTAEKNVSLLSGTNVWMKLMKSKTFGVTPFFIEDENSVWEIPYASALCHNTDDVLTMCRHWEGMMDVHGHTLERIRQELGLEAEAIKHVVKTPVNMTMDSFLERCEKEDAFVFIGLHGGFGENGTLQAKLAERGLQHNGSNEEGAVICMDKAQTGIHLNQLKIPGVRALTKYRFPYDAIGTMLTKTTDVLWHEILDALNIRGTGKDIVVKPNADGCSAGVTKIENAQQLRIYLEALHDSSVKEIHIHEGYGVQLPDDRYGEFIAEEYVVTDDIIIKDKKLTHTHSEDGYLEMTVGVFEVDGQFHSLNPSITIAEGKVLSVEEKFQGGTGVNITPPPTSIVSAEVVAMIKNKVEMVAKALSIRNYARIDVFVNKEGEMVVIEANTLPGMTGSTVLFQQGGKEEPAMTPLELIETIINNKMKSRS